MWQHWLNFILGLWIILSAFIMVGSVANFAITGILIAVLALWGGLQRGMMMSGDERMHKHA